MRHIREGRNLSQESMAAMMEMSLSGYARLERGDTDIPWSRIEQFSEKLAIKPWDVTAFGEGINIHVATSNGSAVGYNCNHNTFNNGTESVEILQEKLLRIEAERDAARQAVAHLEEIVALLKRG